MKNIGSQPFGTSFAALNELSTSVVEDCASTDEIERENATATASSICVRMVVVGRSFTREESRDEVIRGL